MKITLDPEDHLRPVVVVHSPYLNDPLTSSARPEATNSHPVYTMTENGPEA